MLLLSPVDDEIAVDDLPDEEIMKLHKVYDSYDSNHDGEIIFSEFSKLVSGPLVCPSLPSIHQEGKKDALTHPLSLHPSPPTPSVYSRLMISAQTYLRASCNPPLST
jgi:hypothetical protein